MNNFTLAQKQYLETVCESGHIVIYIEYDPSQITVNPETALLAAGYTEYYRENSADLNEVIYTK